MLFSFAGAFHFLRSESVEVAGACDWTEIVHLFFPVACNSRQAPWHCFLLTVTSYGSGNSVLSHRLGFMRTRQTNHATQLAGGLLQEAKFLQMLEAVDRRDPKLEIVSALADQAFEFPSATYFQEAKDCSRAENIKLFTKASVAICSNSCFTKFSFR